MSVKGSSGFKGPFGSLQGGPVGEHEPLQLWIVLRGLIFVVGDQPADAWRASEFRGSRRAKAGMVDR